MWRSQSTRHGHAPHQQPSPSPMHHGTAADNRISFEITEEDVEALRQRFSAVSRNLSSFGQLPNANGNGCSTSGSLEQRALMRITEEQQRQWQAFRLDHPCVLEDFEQLAQKLQGKRLAVFLDYDGTLAPIVANPDEAIMSEEMRSVVRQVATMFPTAIISGRGREKVEAFVGLKELFYAGSHGMDIRGPETATPDGSDCSTSAVPALDNSFQPAAHFRPIIDDVYGQLNDRLASIPGSGVEHNTFCVSAHFRNVAPERWQDVVAVVDDIAAQYSDLRVTRGRKVLEIRPKLNWHKGTALSHLVDALGLSLQPDVVAIYIGDDHTDEDAFRTLQETQQGFGILVSTKVKATGALYTLRDPSEVQQFLRKLVQWGSGDGNGWHLTKSCRGWRSGSVLPEAPASNVQAMLQQHLTH